MWRTKQNPYIRFDRSSTQKTRDLNGTELILSTLYSLGLNQTAFWFVRDEVFRSEVSNELKPIMPSQPGQSQVQFGCRESLTDAVSGTQCKGRKCRPGLFVGMVPSIREECVGVFIDMWVAVHQDLREDDNRAFWYHCAVLGFKVSARFSSRAHRSHWVETHGLANHVLQRC